MQAPIGRAVWSAAAEQPTGVRHQMHPPLWLDRQHLRQLLFTTTALIVCLPGAGCASLDIMWERKTKIGRVGGRQPVWSGKNTECTDGELGGFGSFVLGCIKYKGLVGKLEVQLCLSRKCSGVQQLCGNGKRVEPLSQATSVCGKAVQYKRYRGSAGLALLRGWRGLMAVRAIAPTGRLRGWASRLLAACKQPGLCNRSR